MIDTFLVFLIWLISSFLLNSFLRRKVALFKELGTPLNLFGMSIIFFLVHKITSIILNVPEYTFFMLSLLSFGFFLFSFQKKEERKKHKMFYERKKRTRRERAKIQNIAAQSQLQRLQKKQ